MDVCFELHPGEDLFDGTTFERFLEVVGGHKRCCINYDPSHFRLQNLDYVGFIDVYHERIKAFHVKDAELRSTRQSKASIRASPIGPIGRAVSARSATATSTSARSSPSLRARLRQLGGARMGMRDQEPGRRRSRGRGVHPEHLIKVSESTFEDFIDQGADLGAVNRALGIRA